ncbi:hypothetical protein Bca101_053979 [Brassica carinata]
MFLMVTAPLPPRFRPPPDPPPCKFPPLGSLSPIEPPEPPDPPDAPALLRFLTAFSSLSPRALVQTLDLVFPFSTTESRSAPIRHNDLVTGLCSINAKSVDAARLPRRDTIVILSLSAVTSIQLWLPLRLLSPSFTRYRVFFAVTSFYSAIEFSLPITSRFHITMVLYLCCSCAAVTFGLEDCSTTICSVRLFKGSAYWCHFASAIIATVKIVIPALAAVPITSIRSLIVFFVFHGVIPLLKPSIVEIRGCLSNVSCLLTIWLFIAFAVIIVASPWPVSSRKLLEKKKQENFMTVREEVKNHMPHVTKTTTLTALPKGKIQNSTPSKKGYAVISNVKLRSRHLSTVDRLLQSVPSPGVGH